MIDQNFLEQSINVILLVLFLKKISKEWQCGFTNFFLIETDLDSMISLGWAEGKSGNFVVRMRSKEFSAQFSWVWISLNMYDF